MVDMHESASIGDLEGLEEALNSGYHPDDPDNDWGIRTALHLSASAGFRACVALLIARGADVNAQMYDNSTPLHCACEIGHLGIIFLLLNHGANPLAIDRFGITPLRISMIYGYFDCTQVIINHINSEFSTV